MLVVTAKRQNMYKQQTIEKSFSNQISFNTLLWESTMGKLATWYWFGAWTWTDCSILFLSGNHSCVANAEVQFNDKNNILTVVTLRDIAEEEVGI